MGFFLPARAQTQRGLLIDTMAGDPSRISVIRKTASGGGRWGGLADNEGASNTAWGVAEVRAGGPSMFPPSCVSPRSEPGGSLLCGLGKRGQVDRSRQLALSGSGRAGEGKEKSLGICQCVSFSKLPIHLSSPIVNHHQNHPILSQCLSRCPFGGDQLSIMC